MRRTLKLDDQLCFAIYAASHAFNRFYKPLLGALGLTYPQYLALLVLWETDQVTLGEIGERLGLDSGTLTPLLKRMETAGLVTRLRDAKDERLVRIKLSATGLALKEKAEAFPQAVKEASGCSATELNHLQMGLADLRQQLDGAAAPDDAAAA